MKKILTICAALAVTLPTMAETAEFYGFSKGRKSYNEKENVQYARVNIEGAFGEVWTVKETTIFGCNTYDQVGAVTPISSAWRYQDKLYAARCAAKRVWGTPPTNTLVLSEIVTFSEDGEMTVVSDLIAQPFPEKIVLAPDGYLYVLLEDGKIGKLLPSEIEDFSDKLTFIGSLPAGIIPAAFCAKGDMLYVLDYDLNFYSVDPDNGNATLIGKMPKINGFIGNYKDSSDADEYVSFLAESVGGSGLIYLESLDCFIWSCNRGNDPNRQYAFRLSDVENGELIPERLNNDGQGCFTAFVEAPAPQVGVAQSQIELLPAVYVENGKIVALGAHSDVEIYSVSGVKVAVMEASSATAAVELPAGIYVAVTGGKSVKLAL